MAAFLAVPDCARAAAQGVRLDQYRFHFDRSPHRRADRLGRGLAAGRAGAQFRVGLRNRVVPAWRKWRTPRERPAEPGPPPAAADPAAAARPPDETLSARLYRLDGAFAPTASTAAHPRDLAENRDFLEAVDLLKADAVSFETVLQYALGANWGLACAALAALRLRPDGSKAVGEIEAHFDRLQPWPMYFALEYFVAAAQRPPVGAPVAGAQFWWGDHIVIPMLFRDYFTQRERLGDAATFGTAPPASASEPIKFFLERIHHPYAAALIDDLDSLRRANVDRAFLASFGRFWEESKGINVLIEPEDWKETLAEARTAALAAPARSLLVSGEGRVGKTSFLRLLAARLRGDGWTVFEAGGADLMAGQQWFGQLEGRIQRVLDELTVSKKIVWYIPDILQIALSGTHQGQAASILDQILPAIAAGRLVVWTEASPAGTTRLLRLRPVLRGAFELARMEPQDQEDTLELAHTLVQRVGKATGIAIDPRCVETAVSSARQYLSAASFPGPVLDLLKLTLSRVAKAGGRRMSPHSVIETLAQHTGLPASILDSSERVDLKSIRDYFSARVMGQPEAVDAVVDRIAMLKAGLNDPGKPIGVFLFAGPTGTGKTELAKTAAEFLFGSADRLIRLDMSELQTPEIHPQDPRRRRDRRERFPHRAGAQAAVLGGASGRVREGARQRLGPVPAGVRRRAAHRLARQRRRLPPLPHHPHHQPRCHQPPGLGPRLLAGGGNLLRPPDRAGDRARLPA